MKYNSNIVTSTYVFAILMVITSCSFDSLTNPNSGKGKLRINNVSNGLLFVACDAAGIDTVFIHPNEFMEFEIHIKQEKTVNKSKTLAIEYFGEFFSSGERTVLVYNDKTTNLDLVADCGAITVENQTSAQIIAVLNGQSHVIQPEYSYGTLSVYTGTADSLMTTVSASGAFLFDQSRTIEVHRNENAYVIFTANAGRIIYYNHTNGPITITSDTTSFSIAGHDSANIKYQMQDQGTLDCYYQVTGYYVFERTFHVSVHRNAIYWEFFQPVHANLLIRNYSDQVINSINLCGWDNLNWGSNCLDSPLSPGNELRLKTGGNYNLNIRIIAGTGDETIVYNVNDNVDETYTYDYYGNSGRLKNTAD